MLTLTSNVQSWTIWEVVQTELKFSDCFLLEFKFEYNLNTSQQLNTNMTTEVVQW